MITKTTFAMKHKKYLHDIIGTLLNVGLIDAINYNKMYILVWSKEYYEK